MGKIKTGYSQNGLPYVRFGNGYPILVIFDGLDFSHKLDSGIILRIRLSRFNHLGRKFTVYLAGRKPGLPVGYTIQQMADDYATMIIKDIQQPVDILGISTGGAIAQYFAVYYPDLVKRLVLVSTGYSLSDKGRQIQRQFGNLVKEGKWRAASTLITGVVSTGIAKHVIFLLIYLFGKIMLNVPANTSDGLIEIEAEDIHNFKDRLADIKAPTLVIGGEKDYFYPIAETAAGIPKAKLITYKGAGHDAQFRSRFSRDILAFLTEVLN
ncbi:MAG: alpha/beta hydrolase [Dehalococcoidales bacterium]|nr:alpha/beta hydrolase [Dehalococcoidales bacterium]